MDPDSLDLGPQGTAASQAGQGRELHRGDDVSDLAVATSPDGDSPAARATCCEAR